MEEEIFLLKRKYYRQVTNWISRSKNQQNELFNYMCTIQEFFAGKFKINPKHLSNLKGILDKLFPTGEIVSYVNLIDDDEEDDQAVKACEQAQTTPNSSLNNAVGKNGPMISKYHCKSQKMKPASSYAPPANKERNIISVKYKTPPASKPIQRYDTDEQNLKLNRIKSNKSLRQRAQSVCIDFETVSTMLIHKNLATCKMKQSGNNNLKCVRKRRMTITNIN